jgi:triosephosphate isomerase
MRKQIAAANWKMNLTYQKAEKLLDDILSARIKLAPNQLTIFAVPFPYLILANSEVSGSENYFIAAQNCYDKKSGAYTGEISAEMLESIGIKYCVLGHSERREYFEETNKMLADKIDLCLEYGISPIFCCGEALAVREKNEQNSYVRVQLEESLFHLKLLPNRHKKCISIYVLF